VIACGALAHGRHPQETPPTQADGGARIMGREILPVWRRQLAASRDEADRGVQHLLQHFSSLSDGLNEAIQATESGDALRITAGATDDILEKHPQALELLTLSSQRLRSERQSLLVVLREIEAGQDTLHRIARDMAKLSRHAGMVAMNAAIEANRAGQSQGGFGAVAQEVRELADQAHDSGQQLLSVVNGSAERLVEMRRNTELAEDSDETLGIQTRQQAREVIDTLVAELGTTLEQSRRLRETSQRVRDDLDGVFVSFQFQDRLNQMLGSVQDDMDRFEEWLRQTRAANQADAQRWLERLEASYTMEEQRSFHHGTTEIRKSAGVEFF
jgi:methyl-accepting chemotaxis protein